MKKIQSFILFSLILFYSAIFYIALNPRVSSGYKSYYITRDSGLTLKERKALKPITLEDEISYMDTRVGYDGWHDNEIGYRWSAGKSSKIVFLLPANMDKSGTRSLLFSITPLEKQRISFFLNDQRIYSGTLDEKGRVDISFPASLLSIGDNVIRIDCPDAHSTEADRRHRGIALSSFIFK